jgi:hypothetical protein
MLRTRGLRSFVAAPLRAIQCGSPSSGAGRPAERCKAAAPKGAGSRGWLIPFGRFPGASALTQGRPLYLRPVWRKEPGDFADPRLPTVRRFRIRAIATQCPCWNPSSHTGGTVVSGHPRYVLCTALGQGELLAARTVIRASTLATCARDVRITMCKSPGATARAGAALGIALGAEGRRRRYPADTISASAANPAATRAQARGPGPAARSTTERPHEPADLKGEAIETRRSQTATQQGSGVAAPVG